MAHSINALQTLLESTQVELWQRIAAAGHEILILICAACVYVLLDFYFYKDSQPCILCAKLTNLLMQKRSWILMTSLQATEWLNYMLVIARCLLLSYPGGAVLYTLWFSHQIAVCVFERPRGGCIENLSKTNVQSSM